MKFYIDFEATQPANEIIAIGAVAENGATFHSLVKPQLSSISPYVSQLTHISADDLKTAPTIDKVLIDFDLWVMTQENNIMKAKEVMELLEISRRTPITTQQRAAIYMVMMLNLLNVLCLQLLTNTHLLLQLS